MIEAREEAAVEEVPGEECSARIVVRWAMHELGLVSIVRMLVRGIISFGWRCTH
jgi:hypothetical protein